MAWLKVFGFALIALALLGGTRQSEDRVGNLLFKTPQGWSKDIRGNVAVLRPGGIGAAELCQATITAGVKVDGSLMGWVERQFEQMAVGQQIVQKNGQPFGAASLGWEGAGLGGTLQAPNGRKTYHLLMVFRGGGEGATLHFVSDNLAYVEKYTGPVSALAGTLKPAPSGTPAGTVDQGQTPAGSLDSGPAPNIYLPAALPPPAAMPAGAPKDAAGVLAKDILKGGPAGLAALQRAVLASGFAIHDAKTGAVLHSPPAGQANGLSFADIDLLGANALAGVHGSVTVAGLESCLTSRPRLANVKFGPLWVKTFAAARTSPKTWNAFFGHLMAELGRQSGGKYTALESYTPDARLSASQMFLISWRTVGHLAAMAKPKQTTLSPGDEEQSQQGPGGDAVADLLTTVDSFSSTDWSAAIEQILNDPFVNVRDINLYILAMARLQILLAGLHGNVHYASGGPLVRSKTTNTSGEDKLLHIDVSVRIDPSVWQKLLAAVQSCGYSLQDLHQTGPTHLWITFSDEQSQIDRIMKRDAEASYTGKVGERARYQMMVTGAMQRRALSGSPKPDPEDAIVALRVKLGAQDGPGRLIQAHNEVQGLVSMPFETYFYGFLETQNWKVDGWTGFFKIEVEGKGFYKIGFNMGSFTTSRRYMVSGALDQRVPIALISGLSAADSLKAGIYSVMTSQPMYAHVDSQFQDQVNESGPELDADCIEDNPNKRSSLAETRAKRDPENLAESAAYRSQYMRLEINPNTFTYKMRALGGTPSFLLSVSRTVDGKTTNSRTTGGIFDGLTYRDVPLVYGERAVFSGPIEDQGTYISGKLAPFELPYRRFRWKSAPPQKVTVKVSWEFIGKVGGQSPTIARMMEFTAKQLVAQAGAHGVISLPEIMGEADELAGLTTCEGVEVKTSGQLRHKKDGARP